MPLSEEEQRALEEIERQFYETDPDLARTVRTTTVYTDAGRNVRWAVLGLVVSFVVLVVGFTRFLVLGVAGFVGMLACAIVIERNVRRMGRATVQAITGRVKPSGMRTFVQERQARIAERLRRRDQP